MASERELEIKGIERNQEEPMILEEISIEDLFVDGICGVY